MTVFESDMGESCLFKYDVYLMMMILDDVYLYSVQVYRLGRALYHNIEAGGGYTRYSMTVDYSRFWSVEVVRGKRADISGRSSRTEIYYS